MERDKVAAAFTEWMRRYIETPEEFEREFETVLEFMDGGELSYGEKQAAYLMHLIEEMGAK